MEIIEILVDSLIKPIGIDTQQPTFSWKLASEQQNTVQTAFELKVFSDKTLIWDSKKEVSSQSTFNVYQGPKLQAQTKYLVEVTVWDNHHQQAQAETEFETGLFGGDHFKADWISTSKESRITGCPVFFTNFSIKEELVRARLYVSSLGIYQAEINQQKVGDAYFTPGWTNYNQRIQYQTYDVTEQLKTNNILAITVANGWYKGTLGFMPQAERYGKKVAVIAQVKLDYEDGTSQIIATDETDWQVTEGALRMAEFYNGENYDSTYSKAVVEPVKVIDKDKSLLVAQEDEFVKVIKHFSAKKLIQTPAGETVIDFGQNIAGFVNFKIQGKTGQKITLRHAEALDQDGNFYTGNLSFAKAEDTYICDGSKQEFHPNFTYHGFRYISLIGFEADQIELVNFTAWALSSELAKTGLFTTSNKLINQLQNNIVWGQLDNFVDIPTDCPQRSERLGWTGDVSAFCHTAVFNRKADSFFKKWLRDLASEQSVKHGVPQVVPDIVNQEGTAFWGDVATILPWRLYQTYGNLTQLRENYPIMQQWIEYIQKHTNEKGLWQSGYQYGDWLALDAELQGLTDERVGATDRYLIANIFYANSLNLTAKAANELGEAEAAAAYHARYQDLMTAIRQEYVTANGRLVSETQTACVLALHFNLVPEKNRSQVLERLINNLAEHKNHLTTGFVGTPFVCHVLSENGAHDLARKILLAEDCPSWLYEISMGATTIWERWDSILPDGSFNPKNMNSLNHYAYGSIGDWMYREIGGLKELAPGYRKFMLRPRLTKGFTDVNLKFESVYGAIICNWECKNQQIKVVIEIPANTTAEVWLPEKDEKIELGSGKYSYQYATQTKLEIPKYSMETPLHVVLENDAAREFLNQAVPGMLDNQMLQYVQNEPVNTVASYSAEARPLFEKVIEVMNQDFQAHNN